MQESANLERAGKARAEKLEQVRHREARIDDVLDEEHVFTFQGMRQIVGDLDDAAGGRALPVAANPEKFDAHRQGDGASQVGREDEAPLQDANEDR
jgi:hypothetical protein